MTAITAMMRRNSTSRRVQTFSSDAIRSDDIAATEMALSRGASRDGVSDMRIAVHGLEWVLTGGLLTIVFGPRSGTINRTCRDGLAVTEAAQSVRSVEHGISSPPSSGETSHGDQIR